MVGAVRGGAPRRPVAQQQQQQHSWYLAPAELPDPPHGVLQNHGDRHGPSDSQETDTLASASMQLTAPAPRGREGSDSRVESLTLSLTASEKADYARLEETTDRLLTRPQRSSRAATRQARWAAEAEEEALFAQLPRSVRYWCDELFRNTEELLPDAVRVRTTCGGAMWVEPETGEVPWREVDYGGKGGGGGGGGEGVCVPGAFRVTTNFLGTDVTGSDSQGSKSGLELESGIAAGMESPVPVNSNSVPSPLGRRALFNMQRNQRQWRSMISPYARISWPRIGRTKGQSEATAYSGRSKLLPSAKLLANLIRKAGAGKRKPSLDGGTGLYIAADPTWNPPGCISGKRLLWDDRIGPKNERWAFLPDTPSSSLANTVNFVEFTQVRQPK